MQNEKSTTPEKGARKMSGSYKKRKRKLQYEIVRRKPFVPSLKRKLPFKRTTEKPIASDRSLSKIERAAEKDPFEIHASQRDSLNEEEIIALYELVFKKHGNMIERELDKSPYIILCDSRVISRPLKEPSDEEIMALEKKHGKICYIIRRDLIEEIKWAPLGDNDYYPTVELFLGDPGWSDEDIFNKGTKVIADFDTGNPNVAAFSNEKLPFLKGVKPITPRRGTSHLGVSYYYQLRRAKVGVRDFQGKKRCIVKDCSCVLKWDREKNPFLITNPNREGLVGRDIMMTFPFEVTLSPINKSSILRLI